MGLKGLYSQKRIPGSDVSDAGATADFFSGAFTSATEADATGFAGAGLVVVGFPGPWVSEATVDVPHLQRRV